jgi:pyruvate formate lyase activating enzyme
MGRGLPQAVLPPPPPPPDGSLQAELDRFAVPGVLGQREGDDVRCFACGHRCLIRPGRRGICKVRFNAEGTLMVPRGWVAGLQSDPVEKKPFFHMLPGTDCLTFGMLGCDYHCGYCQNWITSQALRDPSAPGVGPTALSAERMVGMATKLGSRSVASSYNEPLITAEWGVEVFRAARAAGLRTAFVSNGNATPEVLDFLRPHTDAYKIDFKAMRDAHYRKLGGVLQHVLDAMRLVHERGFWMEIVTLVVPGFSDDPDDLKRMAETLAAISPDVPWHVTAFHRDYQMTSPRDTTADDLVRACEIGAAAGLRFVYAGNLPGRVGPWEHTRCPGCGETVVERFGFHVLRQRVGRDGSCPSCRATIPGIWE